MVYTSDMEYRDFMINNIAVTLIDNNFKVKVEDNNRIVTNATREDIRNLFSQIVTLDETSTVIIYSSEDGSREESIVVKYAHDDSIN